MLDVLVSIKDEAGNSRFSADEVTGMFISLMFAGHHTSSGNVGVDVDRADPPPRGLRRGACRAGRAYADGQEVSFHALRQIPKLDNVVKEALAPAPAAESS